MKRKYFFTNLIFIICSVCFCLLQLSVKASTVTEGRYGRDILSKEQNGEALVNAYDRIAAGVGAYDGTSKVIVLDVQNYPITSDDFEKVYELYANDYPEHFWNRITRYTFSREGNSNTIESVSLEYSPEFNDTEKVKEEFDQAVENMLAKVPASAESDYQKALIIHDLLIEHITYDKAGASSGGSDLACHTAYGALVEKSAVCDGYSLAYKYLLKQLGVNSMIITGYSKNEAHAWNLVEIDGQWYHTDLTWDDDDSPDDYPYYAYFNVTSELIGEDHTIDEIYKDVSSNLTATAANYFTLNPEERFDALDNDAIKQLAKLLNNESRTARLYISKNAMNNQSSVGSNFDAWLKGNYATLAQEMGIQIHSFYTVGIGREAHLTITPVTQMLAGELSISVNPPVAGGKTVEVTGSGTKYTVAFSEWKDKNGNATDTFDYGTEYTATGTLTAYVGYEFAGNNSIVISGTDSGGASEAKMSADKRTITFTYSFITPEAPKVTGEIAEPVTVKYGEKLTVQVNDIKVSGEVADGGIVNMYAADGKPLVLGQAVFKGSALIIYETKEQGIGIGSSGIVIKYQNENMSEFEIGTANVTINKAELKAVFAVDARKTYDGLAEFKDVPVMLTGYISTDGVGVTATGTGVLESGEIGKHKAFEAPVIKVSDDRIKEWYNIVWVDEDYNILTIEPESVNPGDSDNPDNTPPDTPTKEDKYAIVEGNGTEWKGSDELTFKANGDYDDFLGVMVDKEYVSILYYTTKKGSTIITFSEEYLNTLSAGEHSLTVVYTDGNANGTFSIQGKDEGVENNKKNNNDSLMETDENGTSYVNREDTVDNSQQPAVTQGGADVSPTEGTDASASGDGSVSDSSSTGVESSEVDNGSNNNSIISQIISPKTNDISYALFYTATIFLSATGIGGILFLKRK